ncbi:FAD-binding-3 domain-containing protein [Mycena indigotica]|uniref:FAD-binding-3 domain-containing protein n=1 Tax=Mycena indigotica TaxID=2126181 RepID=A0A8H6SQ78_9AGAR|nr:FAD-binding-3 domain-containing protein [Mycena indigotica]KAF7301975.1 FAD-binding-3 domain-containing protein [Mycena indigotica]
MSPHLSFFPFNRIAMPSSKPEGQQASCILKFVVVGGGITGLATAYSLRTAGHDVVVVEKRNLTQPTQGSIRCPPNMTRVLSRWPGMDSFLFNSASEVSGITSLSFRIGETSETVGSMKFYHEIMEQLGADFLVLQHNDLQREILSLCIASGVEMVCGTVVDVVVPEDAGDFSVNIVLEDGGIIHGNIAIGADGHNSLLRSFVTAEESFANDTRIVTGVDIAIPTKALLEHEHLASLCEEQQFTIWMGSGSSITAVLDKSCEFMNLGICTPMPIENERPLADGQDLNAISDDWSETSQLPIDISAYDPRLHAAIQLRTINPDGTVILVGDAAHSVLIHGSHNTSMGIEDAVTLGALFSHLQNRKEIAVFLETYEELRQNRVQAAGESEYQSLLMICLPPGPERDGRDETLKLTKDREFEDFDNCDPESDVLVQTWEQYLMLFNYDAKEAVDDWWSMWSFTMQ